MRLRAKQALIQGVPKGAVSVKVINGRKYDADVYVVWLDSEGRVLQETAAPLRINRTTR